MIKKYNAYYNKFVVNLNKLDFCHYSPFVFILPLCLLWQG